MGHHRYEDSCREKKHRKKHHCERNMYKTIKEQCDLQELAKAIKEAGLRKAIACTPDITVFGPTDCAFSKFKGACGNSEEILLYHVVPERLPAKKLENDKLYKTLRDGSMPGSKKEVRANVYSKPTFKNVITINGAKVVEANIKASNGVLHKINEVLCPPAGTLLELAASTPSLSILAAAVGAADPAVADVLNDPALSLTLFAPNNKAFERLATESGITLQQLLDILLNPENQELLSELLAYHVLGLELGTVFSAALRKKTKNVPTLLPGKTVDIKKNCGEILVIDQSHHHAKVVSKDNLATNGVAHIIDQVLNDSNSTNGVSLKYLLSKH